MVIAGVSSPSSAPPSVTRVGAGAATSKVDAAPPTATAKPPDRAGGAEKAAPVNPVSPVAHGNLSPDTLRDVIMAAQDSAATDTGQKSQRGDAPTRTGDSGASGKPSVDGPDAPRDEADRRPDADDRTPEQDPAGSLPTAMAARASDRGRAFAAERVDMAA